MAHPTSAPHSNDEKDTQDQSEGYDSGVATSASCSNADTDGNKNEGDEDPTWAPDCVPDPREADGEDPTPNRPCPACKVGLDLSLKRMFVRLSPLGGEKGVGCKDRKMHIWLVYNYIGLTT